MFDGKITRSRKSRKTISIILRKYNLLNKTQQVSYLLKKSTGEVPCRLRENNSHFMIVRDGRGVDEDGFGWILRDGGEGGHGRCGGAPRVVRLSRALNGLDETFDRGLVVLTTRKIFLAQAAYSFRALN
jgi:hypothetical protein